MAGLSLLCVAAHVGYQIMSENPSENAVEMARQVTLQRLIFIVSVANIFLLIFVFEPQPR